MNLSVSFVLCFQYTIAMVIAAVIVAGCKPSNSNKSSMEMLGESLTYDDLVVAIFSYCSMSFSNKAMSLASPPFVILAQLSKVISVILVGKLRGVYNPRPMQYMVAVVITVGLVIFNI
jgi:hypothetical protein